MNQSVNRTPFEILARYERLSLAQPQAGQRWWRELEPAR